MSTFDPKRTFSLCPPKHFLPSSQVKSVALDERIAVGSRRLSHSTSSKEHMSKEPTIDEAKSHDEDRRSGSQKEEIKLQATKRPANLRANATPVDGFVLSIDGKLKMRYESAEDATAAGTKLKQSYSVLQVAGYDATARVYTPIEREAQQDEAASAS